MIVRLLIVAAAFALSACNSQPGCTHENCKAAIEGCRVELGGGPSTLAVVTCTAYDKPATKIDWAKYCVDSCFNQGSGTVIACIASKADACRDGGFAAIGKAIDECVDKTAKFPEKTCDEKCTATRTACDQKCGITRDCDQCLRAGKQCQDLCPDAGHLTCLDCSAQCGHSYTFCLDSCPRE